VGIRAVLGDQHLGPERPDHHPGTTAWKARNHDASDVPAGSAILTDVPRAAPSPHSESVDFVLEVPRTSTGKLRKQELRNVELAGYNG
jgi:acyl-CoA synthetase (AMP-forming)/AMP-acid ligase II